MNFICMYIKLNKILNATNPVTLHIDMYRVTHICLIPHNRIVKQKKLTYINNISIESNKKYLNTYICIESIR